MVLLSGCSVNNRGFEYSFGRSGQQYPPMMGQGGPAGYQQMAQGQGRPQTVGGNQGTIRVPESRHENRRPQDKARCFIPGTPVPADASGNNAWCDK